MPTTSEQFITSMKLRELRKQRTLLMSAYDRLDRRLATTPNEANRLQVLYQDLSGIYFAGQRLHPDVANLEPILYGLDTGARPSPDTVSFWRERLEKELAGGRLRSEIVFIFSALLEEWTQENARATPEDASTQHRQRLLTDATRLADSTPSFDPAFLDNLFKAMEFNPAETKDLMTRISKLRLTRKVEQGELRNVLSKVSQDRYHSPLSRKQAKALMLDEMLIKEFADALSIILSELESWEWPEEGVSVRAALTPSKWRLFLNEDLPTGCLMEILGTRWQKIFEELFNYIHTFRLQRLRKTIQNQPPLTRLEETLKLYRNSFGIKPSVYSEIDLWKDNDRIVESELWEDFSTMEEKVRQKLNTEDLLRYWVSSSSILSQRASLKSAYRDLSLIDRYGVGGKGETGLNTTEQSLAQINAELKLSQAAFPNRPFYVIKADLKNYYPSLPHDLLLEMLDKLGLSQGQLKFFRQYLAVAVAEGKEVVRFARGVPNHRRISDILGELVLLLLDFHLKKAARIQIIRSIDDITLLATSQEEAVKGWQALEEFCSGMGLALNYEKCGAVAIGGKLPEELPQTLPSWSMVTLNGEGKWGIELKRFEEYLTQSQQQVGEADSIIAKVEIFNNSLNYLIKALGTRVALDESHRSGVGQVLLRFQNSFYGENRGMVEELRKLIQERFQGQSNSTSLPDGWLHWPITAGGISLYHPLVLATGYGVSFSHRAAPILPDERKPNWQRVQNGWNSYYRHFLQPPNPIEPQENQVMETLVQDFISRGGEISMGGQYGLSAYWRWILYIYGPQILERLGTFRFLITELVPAQLITQKYRQGLEDDSSDELTADFEETEDE